MRSTQLAVVGQSPAARSLAWEASQAGLEVVLVSPTEIGDDHEFEVVIGTVTGTNPSTSGVVVDVSSDEAIEATGVAMVVDGTWPETFPIEIPETLRDHISTDLPPDLWNRDVLVLGDSEHAASVADELSQSGVRVVLARGGGSPDKLSSLTRAEILRREAERRLTILWHSKLAVVEDLDGLPMVQFQDASTPDLLFDHLIFAGDQTSDDRTQPPVWLVGPGGLDPGVAFETIRRESFDNLAPAIARPLDTSVSELRERHYNATITRFERSHSDLWLVGVETDHGDVDHAAGQYASLGLGYWEHRADAARDPGLEHKFDRLVRRSYSISSPIFDETGYLVDPSRSASLEFYIVLVPASPRRVPAFTPRLALRKPGDRIYVGPRLVGRYTLRPVQDPSLAVVMMATGTGEAPHNAMAVELLRKGHSGPIVSVVSVRHVDDLAYLEAHRRLEERFPNYHYMPLVTRDPDWEKLYVQDVIERDLLTAEFGVELDPTNTHVFLCGNPAMIGLPRWDADEPQFPDPIGAHQLLAERGFDLDRHGHTGTVHSEKYW